MSLGNNIRASEIVADVMASIPRPPEPTPRELELEQQLDKIVALVDDQEADNAVHAVTRALRELKTACAEIRLLRARERVARGTRVLSELERTAWRAYAAHALQGEILGQHLAPSRHGEIDELAARRAAARQADAMLELEARRFDDVPDDLELLEQARDKLREARADDGAEP